MDLDWMGDIGSTLEPHYAEMARASAKQALNQVSAAAVVRGDITTLLSQADAKAIEWAQQHAAEIVGKKWVDGELVDNPDAQWVIEDATRDMLRGKIGEALEEGWSKGKLAKAITGEVFGVERARNIAQTEMAFAHRAGTQAGWAASGRVRGKYSILSSDHVVPDVCDDNADAGIIPLDQDYPSGDEGYPFHPGCECVEVAVLDDDNSPSEAEE